MRSHNRAVISIIGPSGTGKSTLLRCINRLETPTSGSAIIDGEDVWQKGTDLTAVRKKVGMVFQSFNLFGHKNIIENIIMPQMDLLGQTRDEARKEALLQLRRVGLEEKAYNMPDELSGGQKQRVAIARALAMHPQIMLFDEPGQKCYTSSCRGWNDDADRDPRNAAGKGYFYPRAVYGSG